MASIANLNRLTDVVEALRGVYPDMTLNQVICLLLIATNEGISQTDIMKKTNMSDGTCSRIVSLLGKYGSRGTGPFNLVELVADDGDRRFKSLYMTNTGKGLMDTIEAILAGSKSECNKRGQV